VECQASDFTDSNLEFIKSTAIHCMDTAEIIAFDKDLNPRSKFHCADSVWWRRVKPFFCQPADIFATIVPGQQRPNPLTALGGYYHMVPIGCQANGRIVYNEIKNPSGFDLSSIRQTKRNMIRRGLRQLRLQRITSADVLLGQGYEIYREWYQRIFGHPLSETDISNYTRWVEVLQRHPYELVLGAFSGDRLAAWVVARAHGDRANLTKALGNSEFHSLEPTSTLIYAYILICAQNPRIKTVRNGGVGKPSLEEYKAALGFEHVEYPAYLRLPPGMTPLARRLFPSGYKKLIGDF
jgi:hypothetical protein